MDVDVDGNIYAGYEEGTIMRYAPDGSGGVSFAHTGGSVSPEGEINTLTTGMDGMRFGFADDLDIAPNGTIYFSDASAKTGITDYRYDIVEHRPNGALYAYDPSSGRTSLIQDDMYFANGVAVNPDGDFVLVVETSEYRVQKVWIDGPFRGKSEVLMDALPGFPDGISSNGKGVYWIAFPSTRQPIIDNLADNPVMRKLILRLPEAIQPAPERYGFVLGIDGDGNVVYNLQDSLTYSGFGRVTAPQ